MVVVCLHHGQYLIVTTLPFPEILAIFAGLELNNPDSFAGRTSVLFDHTGLERHGFLEAGRKGICSVICKSVRQPNSKVGHFAKRILGPHEFHNVRRWPHLDAQFADITHAGVEARLVAAVRPDLPGIATDDYEIKLLANCEKWVMLFVDIMDQLTAHASHDHTIRERNGIIAMAIGAFVGSAEWLTADINLR